MGSGAHLENAAPQQGGQSCHSETGRAVDERCSGWGWHCQWGEAALAPHPGPPNSHSPLEMMTSLRGVRLGSRGLMRSSTVTAAMALMLVDAVLAGTREGRGVSSGHIKGLATHTLGPIC